ncbi:MFS multidrug transporter [Botrytis cinerea]
MVQTSHADSSITMNMDRDLEEQKYVQKKARHWELVFDQIHVTPEVLNYPYKGSGTEQDPFVVEFIPGDRRNPMNFPMLKKWTITILLAFATLAVSFVSSAYSGGVKEIIETFNVGSEVVTLGVSLFVLGFAIGPLIWAPLSELYGRQVLFCGTYAMLTIFNAGAAGAQNMQTLLIMRFIAGSFGSSPLTNAGGVIADMFSAAHRGVAMSIFAAAPFLGPVAGPIVGGFLGETEGWRWVEGLMAIFTGVVWIIGSLTIPETYSPVILRRRANKMSSMTGKVYKSRAEVERGSKSISAEFKTALSRPWILLFTEPIVLLLSLYMAIVYGTLYMMFGAFPIVFQTGRGWSAGIGGLAFCGVAVGMISAVFYSLWDNKRYNATAARHNNAAPPEARLPPALVGSICLPVGTAPFGFGMVLVFLSVMNYLIDAYVLYAASVLAANSVLRSLFGAAFPLFTSCKYVQKPWHSLGKFNSSFPRTGLCTISILVLQVWSIHSNEVQVCGGSGACIGGDTGASSNEDEAEQTIEDMEEREARRQTAHGESEKNDAVNDGEKREQKTNE